MTGASHKSVALSDEMAPTTPWARPVAVLDPFSQRASRRLVWVLLNIVRYARVTMAGKYVTSANDLPEDPEGEEIRLQVSDEETKEIFDVKAKIDRNPENLTDPERLTVVKGPHENIEEEWYLEMIETDDGEHVDVELLESTMEQVADQSTVINTRSKEVKTLLQYLTERGKFESVSEASRTIMLEYLSDTYPELVSEYIDLKVESERDELANELREDA